MWMCSGWWEPSPGDNRIYMNWGWNGSSDGWWRIGTDDYWAGRMHIRVKTPKDYLADGKKSLRSNWNLYLCSENGNHNARANRPSALQWEAFTFIRNSDNTFSIKGSNGKYADLNTYDRTIKFSATSNYASDTRWYAETLDNAYYNFKTKSTTNQYLGTLLRANNGVAWAHNDVKVNTNSDGWHVQSSNY